MFILLANPALAVPTVFQPEGLRTIHVESPRFAYDPAMPPDRCVVHVSIDEGGVPTAAEGRSCATKNAAAAVEAILRWRWAPVQSGGVPARVDALVTVDFVAQKSSPQPPVAECVYPMKVASTGEVRYEPAPREACQFWPPSTLAGPIPGGGRCVLVVDPTIVRDTPGWLEVTGCPAEAAEAAAVLLGRSVFVTGTRSTTVQIDFPVTGALSPGLGTTAGATEPVERLGSAAGEEGSLDASLQVSEHATPPVHVDLGSLLAAPPPAPTPAPAPAP